MILVQSTRHSNISNNILNEDQRQVLEVLNKSFEAMKNKDIATFMDCYFIDSPSLKEIGGREEIIRTMMTTKKVLIHVENIEVKFRKDNAVTDLETIFGDASVSLRETTELLSWYGFIEKQIHPHRVYSFRKENGKWKILLVTDHSTGEEYVGDPEVIMERAIKKFNYLDIIKIIYASDRYRGYFDPKDIADTRTNLWPILDSLISDYKKVVELDSASAEGYYWLGVMLTLKGEFPEAIGNFKKAIKISQDKNRIDYKLGNHYYRAVLHCSLGQLYLQQNKIVEALNEFKVAIKENAEYSQAYAFISRIYQMVGDIETARTYRLKAFRYNPIFRMEPVYPNSRNKQAQERFSLAMLNNTSPEEFLKQAIELDGGFVSAYYYLGLTYSTKGEWQRAIDYMNKVIELDSRQEDPYWELGVIYGHIYNAYQNKKETLDLSIQNFKKATELNPYVHELYGSLALNYFFKRNSYKAVEILKKAKELRPLDPNVNFYMAMFLKKKLDSDIFVSKKKKIQIYGRDIFPLLQSALDFCTDGVLQKDIVLFYNFLIEQTKSN